MIASADEVLAPCEHLTTHRADGSRIGCTPCVRARAASLLRTIELQRTTPSMREEALQPYKKFWEAFWATLVEQDFNYEEMDCGELVTETAVELGLVDAVPFDPERRAGVVGDPEPGDLVYYRHEERP